MRILIGAVALLALAIPARAGAQEPARAPACRAALDGDILTTTIEFSDGYTVEAPWKVTWGRATTLEDGRPGLTAKAELDRIVEVKPGTTERIMTPFPEPISTTFEGHSEQELAYRAAQIWCLTVLKAQEQMPSEPSRPSKPGKPARNEGPVTQTAVTGPAHAGNANALRFR